MCDICKKESEIIHNLKKDMNLKWGIDCSKSKEWIDYLQIKQSEDETE